MYKSKYNLLVVLLVVLFSTSCATIKSAINDPKSINTDVVVLECVNAWKIMDHTADGVFSIMGELYKQGKISEEQKEHMINEGRLLRTELINTKAAITDYLWEKELGSGSRDKITQIYLLANIVKGNIQAYYKLQGVAKEMYKDATGGELYMPDVAVVNLPTSTNQ